MGVIRKFWSTLRLIGAYQVANLQAAMEYRAAFFGGALAMFFSNILFVVFWWGFFGQMSLGNGWQTNDIVVIWAISGGGIGLSSTMLGNTSQLPQLIMNGGLDPYLAMPRNALLHVCLGKTKPTGWGDALFGLGAYLLVVRPNPLQMLLFVLLCVLVMVIFTSFQIIISSLTFFLGNNDGLLEQMVGALVTFGTYPMDIFQGLVRLLLFTLLPSAFISYVPLQLLKTFTWPFFGGMVGFTLLMLAVAIGLFQLGLRRYESGSLLGMQN